MLRISLVCAFIIGTVGCHGERNLRKGCVDSSCPAPECPIPCPSPKVDIQAAPETVIKVPPQRVVVESPAPVAAPQATPQSVPGAAQAAPGMVVPQGMAFAAQPAAFAMANPFAMPGATVTSSESRTRLAFQLTSIKIPLPWIKVIPIQGPQEFKVQVPPAQTQAAQPQMVFANGMQMMPQAPVFMGQPAMQAQFVGAPAMQANFAQAQAAPQVCPPCPPCPPQTSGVSAERLQKLTAQILELEQQLKAAGQAAPAAAAPAKEVKEEKNP